MRPAPNQGTLFLNVTFNFDSGTSAKTTTVGGDAGAPAAVVAAAEPPDREGEHESKHGVVLVGSPNVGKSVLFGALTGTYVTVSNYPGTTVEVTRGRAHFSDHPGDEAHAHHAKWEVLDTPGTNNLVPMSEDEAVTRDILVSEVHDALIQVGDAKNLARTLLMTLQLAELGVPFLLNLNMMDEARARGIRVDLEALARELPGVRVNASTATRGEGIEALRTYLEDHEPHSPDEGRSPLACAPSFPDDVEQAIATISEALPRLPVAPRAIATMLLGLMGDDRGLGGWLVEHAGESARDVAKAEAERLTRAHGVPAFALLSKLRLARAQAIVRAVQSRVEGRDLPRGAALAVSWPVSAGLGAAAAAIGAIAYDTGLARLTGAPPSSADPLEEFGFIDIARRVFSADVARGWSAVGIAVLVAAAALSIAAVRRHAGASGGARGAAWKLAACIAVGYGAYWVASTFEGLALHTYSAWPIHLGAAAALASVFATARFGDARDAAISRVLGRYATHPTWGIPILVVALFYAYKVVGVFGAGTAVDYLENEVFGGVAAEAALDAPSGADALTANDDAADGTSRLVVLPGTGAGEAIVVAQVKADGAYADDKAARVDLYRGAGGFEVRTDGARTFVSGELRGASARIWTGALNRWAYALFVFIGVPFLTALIVGKYGLLTMGVTYAVAIVLPVVTTFFFVFSMLEDSGYLPRLAVMANKQLRAIGLNGKAVLPMVLGLGCDTMATLTARIMETKKERVLVTLLLALGIPCSSQLSVVFAMMQRTSKVATFAWIAVVLLTIAIVGWVSAKVIPGDRSDFLLEMPPIRRPMVRNLAAKTMARIEWYLREAVPLFLAGTLLLFVLDRFSLLGYVHTAGEPVVYHLLGFARDGGVSDRVSEALLIGFLRRDFGAAGLLDMTRGGHLSSADIAVSMVTITLFIPCIANVFMIVKERGWKVAGMMCAFIFPYAVAVGALVRVAFRLMGGS